jgi:hypothetical protein
LNQTAFCFFITHNPQQFTFEILKISIFSSLKFKNFKKISFTTVFNQTAFYFFTTHNPQQFFHGSQLTSVFFQNHNPNQTRHPHIKSGNGNKKSCHDLAHMSTRPTWQHANNSTCREQHTSVAPTGSLIYAPREARSRA